MNKGLRRTRCVLLLCPERRLPSPTSNVQTEYATTAVSILKYFGLEDLAQEFLTENGDHNLGNLLSLDYNPDRYFDGFRLWFEGTDEVRYS